MNKHCEPVAMSEEEHKYVIGSRWVKETIVTIEIDGEEGIRVATPPDFWTRRSYGHTVS